MRNSTFETTWRPRAAVVLAFLALVGPAWGQQSSSRSNSNSQNKDQSKDQSKDSQSVVRTFGSEGGYRTEVKTETKGKLAEEDVRQASLLAAQVFMHINEAREKIDADEPKEALKEVNKARDAIKAIRQMLPKSVTHTRTLGPDGKVVFEDERETQPSRIPLYEGILHARTLEPILAARRNAMEVTGFRVVESETIATEVLADLDPIEGQLHRAAKALEQNKTEDAGKALNMALIRGIVVSYNKDDSPLTAARDALWLARRSLEENNPAQAAANLAVARQRLLVYRQVLSQDQRQEVDEMLREVQQLEAQLRQEGNRQVTQAERSRQGSTLTHWWDRVNSWFRRHL
jgi:hypothetical protein